MSKPKRKVSNQVDSYDAKPVTDAPIDKSPYVCQRDKPKFTVNLRNNIPFTEKQKAFIALAKHKDTRVIFFSGPAGTSKTLLSVYVGLLLLNDKKISEIVYIRSIIESASKSLGSLPGEAQEKFLPFAQPLIDKLDELLGKGDIDKLLADTRVKPMPINYLRGSSFAGNLIIADEAQNFDKKEMTLLLSRIGKYSKFFVCGDPYQSDINGKSSFQPFFDIFNSEESQNEGIYCVKFDKEDIMRSEILKYIIGVIENNADKLKEIAKPKI
jgi:phosphate starvation-inducible protein PhoH and related proteins